MKDEKDYNTVDFIAPAQGRQAAYTPVRACAAPPPAGWHKPKKQARRPKSFNVMCSVMDVESFVAPKPEGAKLVIAPGIEGGHFVPVSFVAKDWSVTPRRIRALLCDGRLLGRVQENGYWEVRFPYSYTFGTRGPGLKRQQRTPVKPKNPARMAA